MMNRIFANKLILASGEFLKSTALLMFLGISLSACGENKYTWKEEVLLHDGSKIIAERTVERGGRHEIGQDAPIKEQSISFVMPGTNESVIWKDEFTADIGGANFLPALLEIRNEVAYMLVKPMGCIAYNKWGRPNPPYVIFKYQGKKWQQIDLKDLPTEFKVPNLISSSPDSEAKAAGGGLISAEKIKKFYEGYERPELKSIVRETVKGVWAGCGEMVYDGNGGWIGVGWFRKQPTLEACLNYCDREKMPAQFCPCNSIFKGK